MYDYKHRHMYKSNKNMSKCRYKNFPCSYSSRNLGWPILGIYIF